MTRIFAIFLLLPLVAVSAVAQCSVAETKALLAFHHAFEAAYASADKAKLMATFADDFVTFPQMTGKAQAIDAAIRTFERNKANPPSSSLTRDRFIISCTSTTATITHRVRRTSKGEDGKERTAYSRSLHFLERRNGHWQLVSNAGHDLDDRFTIWYLEQDWNDALLKRDKAWFDQNYASDFTGVSSLNGKLSSKAEDIADTINDKGTMELAETTDMSIRVDGDKAIVIGVFRTKGRDEKGQAYDRRARFTDTWIKRDGRWLAWASQGTIIQ